MRTGQLSDPALLEHYRQLAAECPAMAPMRDLVEILRGRDYAEAMPAGTSIDRLTIGAEESDGIVVIYWPAVRAFEVHYCHHRTFRKEKHTGDLGMAERLVDSLVLRLVIRERYQEAA